MLRIPSRWCQAKGSHHRPACRFLASCDLLRKAAAQDTARHAGPSPIETSTKVPLTLARLPLNLRMSSNGSLAG